MCAHTAEEIHQRKANYAEYAEYADLDMRDIWKNMQKSKKYAEYVTKNAKMYGQKYAEYAKQYVE